MTLIFVMTLLGLALFDLGVVENRLVHTSEADARAFEIAGAGVERALWKLQGTFNTNGRSWAAPTSVTPFTGGGAAGCCDSQFYAVATGYLGSLGFDSGNYALEFRQVTAETLPISCKTDTNTVSDVDATKKICDDLIFVRATGNLTNTPAGYSPARTLQ